MSHNARDEWKHHPVRGPEKPPASQLVLPEPAAEPAQPTLDDVHGLSRDSYNIDDHGDRNPRARYSTTHRPYMPVQVIG